MEAGSCHCSLLIREKINAGLVASWNWNLYRIHIVCIFNPVPASLQCNDQNQLHYSLSWSALVVFHLWLHNSLKCTVKTIRRDCCMYSIKFWEYSNFYFGLLLKPQCVCPFESLWFKNYFITTEIPSSDKKFRNYILYHSGKNGCQSLLVRPSRTFLQISIVSHKMILR